MENKKGRGYEKGKRGRGEISKEKLDKVIEKLKEGKSAGGDGIVNKVWKYGGKR